MGSPFFAHYYVSSHRITGVISGELLLITLLSVHAQYDDVSQWDFQTNIGSPNRINSRI